MSLSPYIELKNVSIGYKFPLISKVNATLFQGEVVLLVGNNGVGKTTLMRSLLGQIPLLEGSILMEGKNLKNLSSVQKAHHTAVVFSKSSVPPQLTLYDLVALGKYIYYPYYIKLSKSHQAEVQDIIDKLGLGSYQHHLLSQLSEGNLQKAYIARAFCQNSPFILLDEPTAHLDELNKIMILKLLRDLAKTYGKLILFSSHDFRLAKEFADKIWLIKDSQFYSGVSEDLLSQHQELIRPLLFDLNQGFVPPEIEAGPLEKELLYSFLQKHFQSDFSNFKFLRSEGHWQVYFREKKWTLSSYEDLQRLLSTLL
ncbi:ABC transporter ATP-binding protein [Chryseobacterium sp. A321]